MPRVLVNCLCLKGTKLWWWGGIPCPLPPNETMSCGLGAHYNSFLWASEGLHTVTVTACKVGIGLIHVNVKSLDKKTVAKLNT